MEMPKLMPRIDGHYARTFLMYFGVCLAAMLSLIVVIDLFQRTDEFIEFSKKTDRGSWTTFYLVAQYYLTQAPATVMQYLLPLVVMLAGAITVTASAATNEYTVLRGSGISLGRAMLPVVVPAFLVVYCLELARDSFMPALILKGHQIASTIKPQNSKTIAITKRDQNEMRSVSMGHFDINGYAHNLRIEVRNLEEFQNGSKAFTLYTAPLAALYPRVQTEGDEDQRRWEWRPMAVEGKNIKPPVTRKFGNYRRFPEQSWTEPLPTYVTESMLVRQVLGEAVMTWGELKAIADDEIDARLEMHRRLSEPWAAAALLFLGLGLVMRRSALGLDPGFTINIVIAVLLCVGFYILRSGMMKLGETEKLPVFLAAWLPVLFAAGAGYWQCRRLGQ